MREREREREREEGETTGGIPGIYWPKTSRSFANVNPQKLLRIFFSPGCAAVDPLFFCRKVATLPDKEDKDKEEEQEDVRGCRLREHSL